MRARFALALIVLLAVAIVPAAGAQTTPTTDTTAPTTETTAAARLAVTVRGGGRVVSSPEGIECPGTCSAEFPDGTSVLLMAETRGGKFVGWDGACAGEEAQCGLNVSGNVAVEADFTAGAAPPPPPGPGPAPPPPPPGAILDQIDVILGALPLANIAFNFPKELEVGERAVIQLRMSGRRPIAQLKQEITALGEREGAQIRVADQVDARLSGLGFEIQPLTSERQAVSGEGVTRWDWAIRPTEAGKLTLHLTVAAVIDVRGAQSTHTIDTFEREMDVSVTWPNRVESFLKGNWQWLWATLLAPLGAWLLRRRTKAEGDRSGSRGRKKRAQPRRKKKPPP